MNLLQIAFVSSIGLALLLVAGSRRRMLAVVGVGLALRAFLAFIDHDIYWLPWSGSDSVGFYAKLVEWKRSPWLEALLSPPLSLSSMYPWVLSWFARLFGEGYLFAAFLNVLLGTYNILQTERFASEFLERPHARTAAWFICLFPVSAVLSAVLIRETLIATFLLAALTCFVRSIKTQRVSQLALAITFIFCAALFHGALILCLVLFPLSYGLAAVITQRMQGKRFASPLRVGVVSAILCIVIFAAGPRLSKIGGVDELRDRVDARVALEERRTVAKNSDYPVYLSRSIYRPDIALIRYCYFMFAPFPWMWRGPLDVVAASFGVANLYGFYIIWRYRKRLSPVPLTIFFVVLLTTLMYSAGVSNVGTAIRHRNKMTPAFFCSAFAAYCAAHGRKPVARNRPWADPRTIVRRGPSAVSRYS